MTDLRVVELSCLGKAGDPARCEDVVAEGASFIVLCDGATDKTGWRHDGKSGGRAVAELVARVVISCPEGMPASDMVARITAGYRATITPLLSGLSATTRPSAVFCAVEKRTGRIIRVGDVAWKTPMRERPAVKAIDATLAAARASLLRFLLLSGVETSVLAATDPGRQMIMPALLQQSVACNRVDADDLAYAAIDGSDVPSELIEESGLSADEHTIVIASDGYPRVFESLQQSEEYLAMDLARDPLRIGEHAATKCVAPGANSFDDRSYVRLVDAAQGEERA